MLLQELLAAQLIQTFADIFAETNLPLYLRPYEVRSLIRSLAPATDLPPATFGKPCEAQKTSSWVLDILWACHSCHL